jgi:pilus assembly protein Flp/PilA
MMRSKYRSRFGWNINIKSLIIHQTVADTCGVTAIEYALIAGLIAIAAIAAFTAVGTDLSDTFSSVASQL